MEQPDKWILMCFEQDGTEKSYAVFGSWAGGYLGSGAWKRSSQIRKVVRDDNGFTITTQSGNTYVVGFETVGVTAFGLSVVSQVEGAKGVRVIYDMKENLEILGDLSDV